MTEVTLSAAVQTRGRTRSADYAFLGAAPAQAWWRAYSGYTTFEHPTILLQSDGGRWEAFLSGIPSKRCDAVGTTIRFTLALSGTGSTAGPVLALVGAWLADLVDGGNVVGAELDAAFPEPDVERLLTHPGEHTATDAAARILDAVARVHAAHQARPRPTPVADAPITGDDQDTVDESGDWLWTLEQPTARAAFLERAEAILDGDPGRALVLNLVGTPSDLGALRADPRPMAVLGVDLGPARVPLPHEVAPALAESSPGKAPAPSAGTARRIRTQLGAAIVVIAIVAATLFATLSGLIGR